MSQRNKYLLLLVPLCILATFLLVWFVPRRANSSVPDRNDLPPLSGNATVANNQTSNPHEPATPNTFTGIAFSGITTDPELASLVNQACKTAARNNVFLFVARPQCVRFRACVLLSRSVRTQSSSFWTGSHLRCRTRCSARRHTMVNCLLDI